MSTSIAAPEFASEPEMKPCPPWSTCEIGHEREALCDRVHWGAERHVNVSAGQKGLAVYAGQWMYDPEPHVHLTVRDGSAEADLLKLTPAEARSLIAALQATLGDIEAPNR